VFEPAIDSPPESERHGILAVRIRVSDLHGRLGRAQRPLGFVSYPFILLNLFLSMIVGLQGAILLISAKRADSISSEVGLHTLANSARLQEFMEANTGLTTTVSQLATQIHNHIRAVAHVAAHELGAAAYAIKAVRAAASDGEGEAEGRRE
jgi:uncharacterized membrane protein